MKQKIKDCVEQLFLSTGNTEISQETKEEMVLNLFDKYDDLVANGDSEDTAFYKVVSGIGDVNEFMNNGNGYQPDYFEMQQKQQFRKEYEKYSTIKSLAIGLYILCPLPPIGLGMIWSALEEFGVLVMLMMIAVATVLVIYASNGIKMLKMQGNLEYVNNRRERRTKVNLNKNRGVNRYVDANGIPFPEIVMEDSLYTIKKMVRSLMSTITALLYVGVSMVFGIWGWSWIIFILLGFALDVVEVVFHFINAKNLPYSPEISKEFYRQLGHMITSGFWKLIVTLYFIISFTIGWRYSWMIFLIGAALSQAIKMGITLYEMREKK